MPGIGKAKRQNATSLLTSVARRSLTIWRAGAVKEGTDNGYLVVASILVPKDYRD